MCLSFLYAGKTYIGIKVVQAILKNTRPLPDPASCRAQLPGRGGRGGARAPFGIDTPVPRPDSPGKPIIGPILVICFTNHALDQFLGGLLDAGITEGLIRVGGQSKSERLQASGTLSTDRKLSNKQPAPMPAS